MRALVSSRLHCTRDVPQVQVPTSCLATIPIITYQVLGIDAIYLRDVEVDHTTLRPLSHTTHEDIERIAR